MRRYLYLLHRWLGITLCLFMAMWFFSGVVMMYVGYPKLTPAERLAAAAPLRPDRCCVDLERAFAATGERRPPSAVRLVGIAGEPAFVFTYDKAKFVVVRAADGARMGPASPEQALASARSFAQGAKARYDGSVDEDAWTHSKALDGLRPLHKVYVSDPEATLLYVSGVTGEVVRDASRTERIWNWAGAWIHWLYPFRGGALDRFWHDIVVYVSLAGSILALTGLVVGVLRWRFGVPYRSGSHSPYRDGFMWWHHVVGLIFGVTSVTFVFSGLMSVNPWKIFDAPRQVFDLEAYAGGALAPERFGLRPDAALETFRRDNFEAREIDLRLVDGKGYYVAHNGMGLTRILPAEPGAAPAAMLPYDLLERAGARLVDAPLDKVSVMTAYDVFYFARAPHTMHGNVDKRLPVVRLEFADANATWAHIDPYTGAVPGKLDAGRRASRWLFAFLHSWDWPPLLDARPVWDVFMVTLNAGGFVLSVAGVVIGWRRVVRKMQPIARRLPSIAGE
jgi:uncharacterized iron-regulated membrane protein